MALLRDCRATWFGSRQQIANHLISDSLTPPRPLLLLTRLANGQLLHVQKDSPGDQTSNLKRNSKVLDSVQFGGRKASLESAVRMILPERSGGSGDAMSAAVTSLQSQLSCRASAAVNDLAQHGRGAW